jgi:dienelactone hydrolase
MRITCLAWLLCWVLVLSCSDSDAGGNGEVTAPIGGGSGATSSGGAGGAGGATTAGAGAGGNAGASSPGEGGIDGGSSGNGVSGDGASGAAPDGGSGSSGDAGSAPPSEVAGCNDARLLEPPEDPAARGPWPVGVRTVRVSNLDVEVWYPAELGSQSGKNQVTYDIRVWLPESERAKISDAESPLQTCDCYRDLPLDAERGPYPGVIYIHGTAAFRSASLAQMTHWASRGFIVAATDHHGLYLGDSLANFSFGACAGSGIAQDLSGNVDSMIAALTMTSGELAFLSGKLDMTRIAIAGHSAGASAASAMSDKPGVRLLMPLAGGGPVTASSTLQSVLFLGGMSDAVVSYDGVRNGYDGSVSPKRIVGITNAGHLVMTELCDLKNGDGESILTIAQAADICSAGLAGFLFDCEPSYLEEAKGTAIVNYATTAALEETLHCADRSSQFAQLQSRLPDVGEFLQAP